jgi:hypothetical protein
MTLHHLFPDHTYCECTFREAEWRPDTNQDCFDFDNLA